MLVHKTCIRQCQIKSEKYHSQFTCMNSRVAFQIKGVVESFATEGAQVSFDVAVAFQVSIQESL